MINLLKRNKIMMFQASGEGEDEVEMKMLLKHKKMLNRKIPLLMHLKKNQLKSMMEQKLLPNEDKSITSCD